MKERVRLTEQEKDDLCDAMVDYTKNQTGWRPDRFEDYVVPAVEKIIAARLGMGS